MEAVAKMKHIRISSRKMKIVLDLIRGEDVKKAMAILKYTKKSACSSIAKVLGCAVANATNNLNMDATNLYISECFVTNAPTLKRIRAASKGRSCRILKRSSHITIKVKDKSK